MFNTIDVYITTELNKTKNTVANYTDQLLHRVDNWIRVPVMIGMKEHKLTNMPVTTERFVFVNDRKSDANLGQHNNETL